MSTDWISFQSLGNEDDDRLEIFYFAFGELRQSLIKSDKRWEKFLINIDMENYMGNFFM